MVLIYLFLSFINVYNNLYEPTRVELLAKVTKIRLGRRGLYRDESQRVDVPGTPFQPSMMLVFKARNLPYIGAPERCFPWGGSGLTCKHYNRLERFSRDKHSSLLRTLRL